MNEPTFTPGVTQQKLVSLVSLWDAAQDRLGIGGFDVITIVEKIVFDLQPLVYLKHIQSGGASDGLLRANLDGWKMERALIEDLGTSNFAHWWTGQPFGAKKWGYAPTLKSEIYLGPDDANAILSRVNEIRDRMPERRDASPVTTNFSRFPKELRTAIEAFDAVRNDPNATRGKTAKQALELWLKANTDLGVGAIERVAMVANWMPGGGSPKTPG